MVTEYQTDPRAVRAEETRDLRKQLGGLNREDEGGIIFADLSKRAPAVPLYSKTTGRRVLVPEHLVTLCLQKVDPDSGDYLFASRPENAPQYVPGRVLCFLHREADERPVLDEIGLRNVYCKKATMESEYGARLHAESRHPTAFAVYREALAKRERKEWEAREERRTDAMLEIARGAAGKGKKAGE